MELNYIFYQQIRTALCNGHEKSKGGCSAAIPADRHQIHFDRILLYMEKRRI